MVITSKQAGNIRRYIALWQLQNYDFNSRNGKIVNQIPEQTYKKLVPYVKDMLGFS
ncbi:hypothetical protein [Lentilactobacillus buchneri]|uniref:hypothetical protein n=1 Tax=Lentilactobacillus buchneri TaxID=1581 RepID=UPI00031B4EDE|nr:hypothetical protein [Lentilactobacillus buchneri]KRK68775.1 hypothetical protein FC79_GL000179 [Lentilactobacillus buchneri DSM 20057]MDS1016111.1 hypothetical protein [Lentilactobacillus buchneri]WCJ51324.1 hypothetical protein OKF32_08670 [Lentilactobacillus sp. Egmn17]